MNVPVTELIKEKAGVATDLVNERVEDLMKQSTQYARLAEKRIKKNPLASVAIAAGVGVVLASVLGRAMRASARA